MNYWPNKKATQNLLRAKRIEREKFLKQCLRGAAEPMTIEAANELGPIDMKIFKIHAGKLFQLVLSLVQEGKGLPEIEKLCGFKKKFLNNLMLVYPRLHSKVKEARKLRTDDVALLEMPKDNEC